MKMVPRLVFGQKRSECLDGSLRWFAQCPIAFMAIFGRSQCAFRRFARNRFRAHRANRVNRPVEIEPMHEARQ
jgi:hypothetical protein